LLGEERNRREAFVHRMLDKLMSNKVEEHEDEIESSSNDFSIESNFDEFVFPEFHPNNLHVETRKASPKSP